MKRTILLAVAFLVVGTMISYAQNPPAPGTPGTGMKGAAFVDANGDGICDNFQSGNRQGQALGRAGRRGFGPGDGTGHQGMGPRDGSGFGAGSGLGGGTCDGTGPKGKQLRRGAIK